MLPEITQAILNAKMAKQITFAALADIVGCNEVFLAAVCYRQASASHEQAIKLLDALGLDHALAPSLTGFPVKGGLMPTVPVDPLALPLLRDPPGLRPAAQGRDPGDVRRRHHRAPSTSPCRSRRNPIPKGIGSRSRCRESFCRTSDGESVRLSVSKLPRGSH